MRAKQHILLDTLHVDFDMVTHRDYAFGQQAVQPPDRNHAVLLHRLDPKPASWFRNHRAGSRVDSIEVEFLLAVGISHGHAVVMMIGAALIRFGEFLNNLLNGIEAMYDEIIVQSAPADVFPTLYADVDEHKRFGKKPPAHHPLSEFGIVVERKVHLAFSQISVISFQTKRGVIKWQGCGRPQAH